MNTGLCDMNEINRIFLELIKEKLSTNQYIELILHGNSMLPTFISGETIRIHKKNDYKIGDIIAYYIILNEKIMIIIHRLIFVRKQYVLTKGDNNVIIDPYKIPVGNILGIVENKM
mgnify:CR=1 FL=1